MFAILSNKNYIYYWAKTVQPLLKQFADDKSWRVRNAFAEIIVDLTESVEPNLVPEMIEMFKGLIKDVEGEVRIQAAKQIHTFCKALPADSRKNYTMQHIIPLLKDLAMGKRLTFDIIWNRGTHETLERALMRYSQTFFCILKKNVLTTFLWVIFSISNHLRKCSVNIK